MGNVGIRIYFFAWDLGVIFLGRPGFKILRFRKKNFLKIQILRCHRKCVGCFLVYLFLGVFFIKNCKEMCMCVGVKNHIVTCKKFIFWCEKGYELLRFYFYLRFRCHFFRHTKFQNFKISKKVIFSNSDFKVSYKNV